MATMQDVARLAGVSLSTVSFVLNNTRPVAAATRLRIEAAMTELGFRRNALARGLASRRSRMLALALPTGKNGLSPTIAQFIAGATDAARSAGYHLVLWPLGHDRGDQVADLCRQGLADGILLLDVHLHDSRVDAIRAEGVPLVLIGRTDDDAIPHVDVDFVATARAGVAHLTALGHTRLGFVNHSREAFDAGYGPTVRMSEALDAAAHDSGVTVAQTFADESAEAGRLATHQLLDSHPDLTALLVMNDDASFGVLQALRERDLAVPDDVSVVSLVSSEASSRQTFPPLTSLLTPGQDLGRLGVQRLVALLDRPDATPDSGLLACDLAEGNSTAQVSGRRPSASR
jgi:DNA-binding LacI/PurR family transcriptional regulator